MMSRRKALSTVSAAILAVGVMAALPSAGAAALPAPSSPDAVAPDAVVRAVARDLHLSVDQARVRLVQQDQAQRVAASLPVEVRRHTVGEWFDEKAGVLAVGVSDEATAAAVRKAGARPQWVHRDQGELDYVMGAVTRLAGDGVAGVTGWGVDPVANAVVVSVNKDAHTSATERFLASLRGFGDGVRVVETESSPRQQGGTVRPGNPWWPGSEPNCSTGFSATGPRAQKQFVTAGHCTDNPNQPAFGGSGGQDRIGTSNVGGDHSVNAREGDMGVVAVTEPGWKLSASVNTWGGPEVTVSGATDEMVGQAVCHSGNTSKWQCGKVTAINQTVDYGDVIIGGLSYTTACSLGGDSGGAWLVGSKAVGLHSGGHTDCNPGGARDQSIFQPVKEPLKKWGLTLSTGAGLGSVQY